MSIDKIYSQETANFILNTLQNTFSPSSKPENTIQLEPIRNVMKSFDSNHIIIRCKESSRSQHKLLTNTKIPTLYSTVKTPLKLHIEYVKQNYVYSNNLWLRIYPVSNDPGFPCIPIACCDKHKRRLCTRYKEVNMLSEESVIEILQYNAKYEYVSLESRDCQVSAVCPYTEPNFSVSIEFKCYNSCLKCTKTNFPNLVFCIEQRNDDDTIQVLAQTEMLLKVCASPGRDSKPKRSLRIQEKVPNSLMNGEPPHKKSPVFDIAGEKCVLKVIPLAHAAVLDQLNKVSKHYDDEFAELIEKIEASINEKVLNNPSL